MPFVRAKLTTGFVAFKRLLQALLAEDIGDETAGGEHNVQEYLDQRRAFQGVVPGPGDLPPPGPQGYFYLVQDDGSGSAAFFVSDGATWNQQSGGGGGPAGSVAPTPDTLALRDVDGAIYAAPPAAGYGESASEGALPPLTSDGMLEFGAIRPITLNAANLAGLPGTQTRHFELAATESDGIFQHFDLVSSGLVSPPAEVPRYVRHTNNGWWQRMAAPALSQSASDVSRLESYLGW